MKYAVWFVRLVFAAWMIPAGLNHFLPLFPQPMGSQPLSMELIIALLDSRLFDIVKAVELIAGIGVLFGFYTPLVLLIWLGALVMMFGGALSLSDRRLRVGAPKPAAKAALQPAE